jgi:hypothetical protein
MTATLLVVALKTDQVDIAKRLTEILGEAKPVEDLGATVPCAWAKPCNQVTALELAAIACLIGDEAAERLNVRVATAETEPL